MQIIKIHNWGSGKTEYYCFSNSARAQQQFDKVWDELPDEEFAVELITKNVHINESIVPGEKW